MAEAADLRQHVGKAVSVHLVDASSRTGYLYAVDPSNDSAVLIVQV